MFVEPSSLQGYLELVDNMRKAVRKSDLATPIMVESTFWAHRGTVIPLMEHLPQVFRDEWLILVSFHFYEPVVYTTRWRNQGMFSYPGQLPDTAGTGPWVPTSAWNGQMVLRQFKRVEEFRRSHRSAPEIRVFLGETGCARDSPGAGTYLRDVLTASEEVGWSVCLYAYRETSWNVMDYELGTESTNVNRTPNPLQEEVAKFVRSAKHQHRRQ